MTDTTVWTCFCCDRPQIESDEMPNACPQCGGVFIRHLDLTTWQRVRHSIRRRFQRTMTFSSADELIAWLEAPDDSPASRDSQATKENPS